VQKCGRPVLIHSLYTSSGQCRVGSCPAVALYATLVALAIAAALASDAGNIELGAAKAAALPLLLFAGLLACGDEDRCRSLILATTAFATVALLAVTAVVHHL